VIHISRDAAKIPPEWIKKAQALTADLEKLATPSERSAFIKKHAGLWGEIKEILRQMSHGKCWYSEAPDAVSDWHVDHFRPKNRAVEQDGTEHEGYPWLAFDWLNYRLCGSFPNSPHTDESGETRGKWDYFPLAKDSRRACWEDRCVGDEKRVLLDPTEKTDPTFITFDETGLPIPSIPSSPVVRERVTVTTKILYLDSPRLKEGRQAVWRRCLETINDIRGILDLQLKDYDAKRDQELVKLADRLVARTQPAEPYSATARACIRAHGMDFVYQIASAEKDAA
jgi:hypothetical protein